MAVVIPTKSNLLSVKRSLTLAELGYELMDRKRHILIREMMSLIDRSSELQKCIDSTFGEAYSALQDANITLGICRQAALTVPEDDSLIIRFRSVMGVEVPIVQLPDDEDCNIFYGFESTDSRLDKAFIKFRQVKHFTAMLAEVENSVYRLAVAIKKTQKRANALRNIILPQLSHTVSDITDALEEKDREEFTRLKVIKAMSDGIQPD